MPLARFQFQSTLPARGATTRESSVEHTAGISIHAPRTGSDFLTSFSVKPALDFNPRSPHGERLFTPCRKMRPAANFNPRSPHGERLVGKETQSCGDYFNPRSPHGERRGASVTRRRSRNFNPRSPHGERHPKERRLHRRADFNPRSPHGERRDPVFAVQKG